MAKKNRTEVAISQELATQYNQADFSGIYLDGKVGCQVTQMRCPPNTEMPALVFNPAGEITEIIGLRTDCCKKCYGHSNL